VTKQKS